VQAREFLRFLFDWQRVLPDARMQGSDAVAAVLAQLEGFEAPAGAWESDIIPARISEYDPHWLDEHCRAGRFVWARLEARTGAREKGAGPIRSTPITLLARRNAKAWAALTQPHEAAQLSYKPHAVFDFIQGHGASFFDDIADGVHMLPVEVEDALAELVALGLVNSDSFGGLRALLVPTSQRGRLGSGAAGRRRRLAMFGMADAGRWATVRRDASAPAPRPDEDAVEHVVQTLLRRWGVIFWKLLAREADWLPSWRDILMCCRRLEARGEIRGGRFIAGFAGEQYASPDAVGLLRDVRRRPLAGQYVSLSGADPLNLLGIVTPGARLPSLTGNRLLYLDGLPVATYAAGAITFMESLDPKEQWLAQNALLRRQVPDALIGWDSLT
jgi:ATP-dependent Lhr-like helicase